MSTSNLNNNADNESFASTSPQVIPAVDSTFQDTNIDNLPSSVATEVETIPDFVDTLSHLCLNVFGFRTNTFYYKALTQNQIIGITDFLSLDLETIQQLSFVNDQGTQSKLIPAQVSKLNYAVQWMKWYRKKFGPFMPSSWLECTSDDFEDFLFNRDEILRSIPLSTLTTETKDNALSTFNKSIKLDINQYTTFKEDRFWDIWHRSFKAQIELHNMSSVLDPKFTPSTQEQIELFKRQQAFVYTVLLQHVQTAAGKIIVREHADSRDARSTYLKLLDRYSKSPEAQANAQEIRNKISNLKLDNTWKSTAASFINLWKSLYLQLEDMTPLEEHETSIVKKKLLENAVIKNEKLANVTELERITVQQGGSPLTYEKYLSLLETAASNYDRAHKNKNPRSVNKTKTSKANQTRTTPSKTSNNRNSNNNSASKKPASSNQQTNGRIRLPPEIWNTLSQAQKDSILQHNRALPRPTNAPSSRQMNSNTTTNTSSTPTTSVNSVSSTASTVPVSNISPPQPPSLINSLAQSSSTAPDLRTVLSTSSAAPQRMMINGVEYHQVNNHHITYNISVANRLKKASLVDGGANGGVAGDDVRVIETSDRQVRLTGLDNHTINDIHLVQAAAFANATTGPVILIFNQYAHTGKGSSIHSVSQMESYGLDVNDKSALLRHGKQRIKTPDGYILPLQIRDGLPYLEMRPPTDKELDSLPHIIMTSDDIWDPSILDNEVSPEEWYDCEDIPDDYGDTTFDEYGEYTQRVHYLDCYSVEIQPLFEVHERKTVPQEPNYEALRPYFLWLPLDTIKRTFAATTQFARNSVSFPMRKHFKSRFPALNVRRRNEPVATDTIFSDVPAIDDGSTCAQIFVGRHSLLGDAYGCKSDSQFINTLEDNIRKRGAMDLLISDRAKAEISNKVQDILRAYRIDDWQSEPHHQHQNYAERRIQEYKKKVDTTLDRTGAPGNTWLLALLYVIFILNSVAYAGLNWRTPMEVWGGATPDISIITQFHFWQLVYYSVDNKWPSESREKLAHFVGFGDTVGDALTYKLLTVDTKKIIYRSAVRPANIEGETNFRLDKFKGEEYMKPVKLWTNTTIDDFDKPAKLDSKSFDPDQIIGLSFLKNKAEDGTRSRCTILRKIEEHEEETGRRRTKYLVSVKDADQDEIMTYNDVVDLLERQFQEDSDPDKLWTFKEIISHEGPFEKDDPKYKGSMWNVLIKWEDDSITNEPLALIASDDPVSCAMYAKENGLLNKKGWTRFKRIAMREKKLQRMINQARLKSIKYAPIYQFGVQVPRTVKEALELDAKNGNHFWRDAIRAELLQLAEYQTFRDMGKNFKIPMNFQRIRVHFVFAVKHDGRRKARLVAGGHMTKTPIDSVYSGVVSIRSLRIVIFLAELNDLQLLQADIGNAYLEAKTKEMVYFIAGKEFEELEGHILIIHKALYGLKTSGARWHDRFADTLYDMGFTPSRADPDVWMRRNGNIYEYIAVYVDDLLIAAKDAKAIIDSLRDKYNYKLKGDGPIEYHLGCDFGRDPDGTLWFGPIRYINKMMDTYQQLFNGEKPKEYASPLDKSDHPELDTSDLLDPNETSIYQSLIGALQWLITLGRFDVATAVMTLSRFRAMPRKGHLDRVKRIYGYLRKMNSGCIRVRTHIPDFSQFPDQNYEWERSIYGNVSEEVPKDAPTPLGKPVINITYQDANLYHDYVTGRSVTGILQLINGTPIDWYSKRQATVETATYGSEFVSAKIATEKSIDMRLTLRYLGVPILGPTYMFGDNQSVVTSSTIPTSSLSKRHNALAYHKVREAIAAKILKYYHIEGTKNPADVLTKNLQRQEAWPHLQPLLFWRGDTAEIKTLH